MSNKFDSTDGMHYVSKFQAFVTDSGLPGIRMEKEDGETFDLSFSLPGIQELQKQLAKAQSLASSVSSSHNNH